MQIMSMIKYLFLCFGVATAMPAVSAIGSELLQLPLPDTRILSIGHVNSKLVVRESRKRPQTILIDAAVNAHLANAEGVTRIFPSAISKSSPPLFVVLTREPSTARRGMGFCGAGLEDYLLLLEVGNSKITLKDKLLLQSCLKSIALASNSGDDPVNALEINSDSQEILFQTLSEDQRKKVLIENGRFRLVLVPTR